MNSRERVHAILDRKPVDRIPVDYWCTGEVYESLAKHCGTNDEFEIYKKLGVDKILWCPGDYLGPMKKPSKEGGMVTPWGVELNPMQAGEAQYLEISNYPLEDLETIEELEKFPWPDPTKYDYDGMEKFVNAHRNDYAILSPWISIFEIYCQMRSQEQAFFDLIEEPEFVEYAIDKILDIQLVMLRTILERVGDGISMLFYSDDMGSQNGMMISEQMWCDFFKDRAKKYCDLAKEFGIKTFYHTDGAARPILKHIAEIGVDVLNPIQHNCPGMDLEGLKKDFGDKLIFHGGVDTQKVLPFGTPDEVRAETQQCLDILGAGGEGYICCSCHNIQAGTPVENILAMIDTIKSSCVS